jgi:hypothetical protein
VGRTLDQVIAKLPPERRERVETRYRELRQEIEGLRESRKLAGNAEAEPGIAPPASSVHASRNKVR